MSPVTEVVLLTLVPGADYAVITESAQIIARQPGCFFVRTSRLLCEPDGDRVHYFIDWDSVDSHMAFARNKAVYEPFRALVGTVMAGYAPPYHITFEPYSLYVFDGVCMVGKMWFPPPRDGESGPSGEETAEALKMFLDASKAKGGLVDGRCGGGWSLEDDIIYKGEKSRVSLFIVGWGSVEDCVRFRDSEELMEAVAGIEALRGLRGLEICIIDPEEAVV
ncbi:hypothetical protein EV127DRAFT_471355 [Xylaria flabelliformis]|nr:hypothetical protein EV127DRAFT_471355 [Xylaria flabelliformis]